MPLAAPAENVSFSPHDQTLVAVRGDRLHLMDIQSGDREVARLEGLQGRDAEFSPNGQTLAAPVGLEGEVALVDARTLEKDSTVETGEAAFVSDVAFSPDGQTLAAGDTTGNVVLWDVASGGLLGPPLRGTNVRLEDLAFSPDGTLLASSDAFARMDLWDVALRRPLGPSLDGAAPAFSEDGELLAAIWPGRGVVLRRLDIDSWREIGCSLANRNLGEEEWDRFLGSVQDYEPTCPGLPRGRPAQSEVATPGE
jgi:WD40 repeat protein